MELRQLEQFVAAAEERVLARTTMSLINCRGPVLRILRLAGVTQLRGIPAEQAE